VTSADRIDEDRASFFRYLPCSVVAEHDVLPSNFADIVRPVSACLDNNANSWFGHIGDPVFSECRLHRALSDRVAVGAVGTGFKEKDDNYLKKDARYTEDKNARLSA
jgi:hypothetical protein